MTQAKHGASLIERAAKVYDFGAYRPAAMPEVAAAVPGVGPSPTPPLPRRRESIGVPDEAAADTRTTMDPRLRGDDVVRRASAAPAASGHVATIDRAMLAEKGMIVPGAPVGPLAEEFRLIKRQLLLTARAVAAAGQADKARSILVCSARPGDGKTFCAINLALSLAAERETEVLLIDGDFAKPDVMFQLGIEDAAGLLDILADPALDPEAMVIRTDVPQLSVLPAGKRTHNDTELLASERTRDVLARLIAADPRRIIVFDSPPALAASPASVLAMRVGQVMLVVRADRTAEGELREAVTQLDGCEHVQLVLNAVSFSAGAQRFGTYYGQEPM